MSKESGVRLFPREWEGTHPLLPRTPEPLSTQGTLTSATLYGCAIGVALGLGRFVNRRVLFRTYYKAVSHQYGPDPAAIRSAIGISTTVIAAVGAYGEWEQRTEARHQAHSILNEARIPPPSPRLWERTTQKTMDDTQILGGMAGALVGLLGVLARTRGLVRTGAFPGLPLLSGLGWALIGDISIGTTVGFYTFGLFNGAEVAMASKKQELQLEAAEKLWWAQKGRPGPRVLYYIGTRSRLDGPEPNSSLIQFEAPDALSTAIQLTGSPPSELSSVGKIEPQAPGSQPHNCVLYNGSLVYAATRDYFWEPENAASGIETLRNHIEGLSKKRAKLTREAEFLWNEVAQWEGKYLLLSKDERETEVGRKQRKAMELLSSMHSNTYIEITEVDWLIADSKKMILQLQTDGKWTPSKEITPDSKVVEGLVEKIRQHQKKTEFTLQQLQSVIVPAENQDQLNEDLKDVTENVAATKELVEHLEELERKSR